MPVQNSLSGIGPSIKLLLIGPVNLKIPQELKPEHVTAIQDTREKTPLNLSPLKSIIKGLDTGDYSVSGLEHLIAVERKSIPDLLMCIGQERERFDREIQRLTGYPIRAIVVEGTIAQIEKGDYRSKVHPNAAIGSIISWQSRGLTFLFCEDHATAGRLTAKFLFSAARTRWRENLPMLNAILGDLPNNS